MEVSCTFFITYGKAENIVSKKAENIGCFQILIRIKKLQNGIFRDFFYPNKDLCPVTPYFVCS